MIVPQKSFAYLEVELRENLDVVQIPCVRFKAANEYVPVKLASRCLMDYANVISSFILFYQGIFHKFIDNQISFGHHYIDT